PRTRATLLRRQLLRRCSSASPPRRRPPGPPPSPYTTLFRSRSGGGVRGAAFHRADARRGGPRDDIAHDVREQRRARGQRRRAQRSEEHTSELQSRENLVCRLLLEKKSTSPGRGGTRRRGRRV